MPREVLHISLGSPACHVSAHYLNLQGLSVTPSSNQDDPNCDPSTTHTIHQKLLVPRALFADTPPATTRNGDKNAEPIHALEPTRSDANPLASQHQVVNAVDAANGFVSTSSTPPAADESQRIQASSLWSGPVERWSVQNNNTVIVDPRVKHVRDTATQLSSATYSRYRAPANNSTSFVNKGYSISSQDQRTVDWDNLSEEEEDEDDEEAMEERRLRQERQETQWTQQTAPQLQQQMDLFWTNVLETPETGNNKTTTEDTAETKNDTAALSWRDYWMPPFAADSILNLPSHASNGFDTDAWNHYYPVRQASETMVRQWIEDDFLERIRRLLEDCDSCQGVVAVSSSSSVYGGLTTQLLHYLKDDCPSAKRWVWSVEEEQHNDASSPQQENQEHPSWRTQRVEQTRHSMETGLMWHDYLEESHSILTLKLPPPTSRQHHALFRSSAMVAASLEAATLPYRLSTNSLHHHIGLNSYYYGNFSGDSPFGSTQRLTLSEFLTNLQPSPGLSVLELDALLPDTDLAGQGLWPRLLQCTSLERDQRMRSPPQRQQQHSREVLPGEWMMDAQQQQRDGVLSSLSPQRGEDRSVHTHFALAASLRYEPPSATTTRTTSSNCVDVLMQGMGVRYRPEQSLAVHVSENLRQLTDGGYGAGSYWRHMWPMERPVLSVLGNTTRFYTQASSLGQAVKEALSPKSRGFFNRDVHNELLPEMDNCHEVLSSLYNLRDRYQPPHGSGLVEDEGNDGAFMD